ncbi:MAG: hypothetical protein AAFR59_14620, partial [Bacteroidota bacterium]
MDLEAIAAQIRHLVAENELELAIQELEKVGKDVSQLRRRWTDLEDKRLKGTHDQNYLDRKENEIAEVILNFLLLDEDAESEGKKAPIEQNLEDQDQQDEAPAQEEATPTFYEQLLRRLRNNKVIAWALVLFAVIFAISQVLKNLGIELFPEQGRQIILEGAVVDSLEQPLALATVKIMRGNQALGESVSEANGSFRSSIELDKATILNLTFVYEGKVWMTRSVNVEVNRDTFQILNPFILPIPKPQPASPRQTTQTTTSFIKRFRVFFQGVPWDDSELGRMLDQETNYQQVSGGTDIYEIHIVFPPRAIFDVTNGVKYDTRFQPAVIVNGRVAISKENFQ